MVGKNKYIIKSKIDGQQFEVDQKVIDSSELLKNLSEFTTITNPIEVDLSGAFLKFYIQLVDSFDVFQDLKQKLLQPPYLDDQKLAKFVKESCVLDSDLLLNELADAILKRLERLTSKEIRSYLEISDDATNFCNLKSKFQSPMNAVLARVCLRANTDLTNKLSQVCKAFKNECDRYPIKLNGFQIKDLVRFQKNEYYMKSIRRRKITVKDDNIYIDSNDLQGVTFDISSLDFIVPQTTNELSIRFKVHQRHIRNFDVQRCPFSNLYITLFQFPEGIDFKFIFDHLIAKDSSKSIKVQSPDFVFPMFKYRVTLTLHKEYYSSKLFSIDFANNKPEPSLVKYLLDYMEDDGELICPFMFSDVPEPLWMEESDTKGRFYYAADLKSFYSIA